MKKLFELNAKEIKEILTEKQVAFEYVINNYDKIWIGFRNKSVYNWISFYDENSTDICDIETYSQNTGKTSKGYATRSLVINRFEKLIN